MKGGRERGSQNRKYNKKLRKKKGKEKKEERLKEEECEDGKGKEVDYYYISIPIVGLSHKYYGHRAILLQL